jgi:excisionase family DNA binding protein
MSQPIDSPVTALLTVEEVAEILRVKKKWIYDHADGRRRPKLPCYEISEGGRKIRRFSREQIKEFLIQCERSMSR